MITDGGGTPGSSLGAEGEGGRATARRLGAVAAGAAGYPGYRLAGWVAAVLWGGEFEAGSAVAGGGGAAPLLEATFASAVPGGACASVDRCESTAR